MDVVNYMKPVKVFRDEITKIHGDHRDELSTIREEQRDGVSEIREGQSDRLRKIREDREDGFVQRPKRKTCKRKEQRDEMTNASRSNKFDVLNMAARGLEFEDVNAVDVVQEIVEIIVVSGCCQERMADPKEGCYEDKSDEDGEAGGSKRQSDTCGRKREIGIPLGQ